MIVFIIIVVIVIFVLLLICRQGWMNQSIIVPLSVITGQIEVRRKTKYIGKR